VYLLEGAGLSRLPGVHRPVGPPLYLGVWLPVAKAARVTSLRRGLFFMLSGTTPTIAARLRLAAVALDGLRLICEPDRDM